MKIILSAVSLALVLPFAGTANAADDVAYCKALAAKYRSFYAYEGGHYRNPGPIGGTIAANQCLEGNTAGIPVLEQKLRNAKVDLPARG